MNPHTRAHESASNNAWLFGCTRNQPWMELQAARIVCTAPNGFIMKKRGLGMLGNDVVYAKSKGYDGTGLLKWRLIAHWCSRERQHAILKHRLGGRRGFLDTAAAVEDHALIPVFRHEPTIDFRQD